LASSTSWPSSATFLSCGLVNLFSAIGRLVLKSSFVRLLVVVALERSLARSQQEIGPDPKLLVSLFDLLATYRSRAVRMTP